MLTYVFDCIISFYPILLPLHRKVPDTMVKIKFLNGHVEKVKAICYIDIVKESSLSLLLI